MEALVFRAETVARHAQSMLLAAEAMTTGLRDTMAAATTRRTDLEEGLERVVSRVCEAGEKVNILIGGFELAEKGIENRVRHLLAEAVETIRQERGLYIAEAQRCNDEAEKWRRLAVANFEASMERLPPRVYIDTSRRRKRQ